MIRNRKESKCFFTHDVTVKIFIKGSNKFNMNNEETQFIFQVNTLFGMVLTPASLRMPSVSISKTTASVIVCLDIFWWRKSVWKVREITCSIEQILSNNLNSWGGGAIFGGLFFILISGDVNSWLQCLQFWYEN